MIISLVILIIALPIFGYIKFFNQTALNSQTNTKPIEFEIIKIDSEWRLKSNYNYSTYKGIINSESDFSKLWNSMINVYDELRGEINPNRPIIPTVDFNNYSVIWYADKGKNASFSTATEMIEYDDHIEIHITNFYSDFGSSHLNLWKIPKTTKPVKFIEESKYEERGP